MTEAQARDDLPGEEWRPVPGWPGYEVSSLGRVYSIRRPGATRSGRILKQGIQPSGHPYLGLCRSGVPQRFYVHQVVALGFLGPKPEGMREIRHLDGNPANNVPSNLKWGTRSENLYDKVRHGTDHNVRKTHCPHGHEYTDANTIRAQGKRSCRTCSIAKYRAYRQRVREARKQSAA